jgi:hypothetical protein
MFGKNINTGLKNAEFYADFEFRNYANFEYSNSFHEHF